MPSSQPRKGRGTPRRAARRSGTPPIVFVVLIAVPLLGIGLAFSLNQRFRAADNDSSARFDPNAELAALDDRFRELRDQTRLTIRAADRESSRFKRDVEALKRGWKAWRADFDQVFKNVRRPDGTLPAEYQGYSRRRAEAGQFLQDLIKTGAL